MFTASVCSKQGVLSNVFWSKRNIFISAFFLLVFVFFNALTAQAAENDGEMIRQRLEWMETIWHEIGSSGNSTKSTRKELKANAKNYQTKPALPVQKSNNVSAPAFKENTDEKKIKSDTPISAKINFFKTKLSRYRMMKKIILLLFAVVLGIM